MSNNKLKKTIVFSTLEGKQLIESIIDDTASATGMTVSATLENELLYNALLPKNENAALWIRDLYQGRGTVGSVIASLAAYLATGIDGYPITDAVFERLIWFCRNWGADINASFNDADSVHYLQDQTESVADVMREYAKSHDDGTSILDIEREAAALERTASDALNSLHVDALFYWEVFSAYPEAVKNYGRTYRLIAWIAKHCAWDNSPKARYRLLTLMREISVELGRE